MVFSSIDSDSSFCSRNRKKQTLPGDILSNFVNFTSNFPSPPEPYLFLRLVTEPETTKPPTHRRSSPIRNAASSPFCEPLALYVSDRHPAAFSTSIDSVFPSPCWLPFSTSAAPRHFFCHVPSLPHFPRARHCHLCVDYTPQPRRAKTPSPSPRSASFSTSPVPSSTA